MVPIILALFPRRAKRSTARQSGFPKVFWGELALAVDNSTLGQIVGREFYADVVAGYNPDKVFPHAAGNVGHDDVAPLDFNPKPRVRQSLHNNTLDLQGFFFLLGHE